MICPIDMCALQGLERMPTVLPYRLFIFTPLYVDYCHINSVCVCVCVLSVYTIHYLAYKILALVIQLPTSIEALHMV